MRLRKIGIASAIGLAMAMSSSLACAQTVLTAASAFPRGHLFSQKVERFIEEVNKRGAGALMIDYKGGAPAIGSPFTLGQRVQRGQFDIMGNTGPYYESIVPEALALMLAEYPVQDLRANGAVDLIQKAHEAKGLHFLGRTMETTDFYLYLRKPIQKADLTGYRLRVAPHYQPFFNSLGATTVRADISEIYTMMENGSIDGFGWPLLGFLPDWLKITKYRVEPGFYNADIQIVINLASWKKLSPEHQKLLRDVMTEFEASNVADAKQQGAAAFKAQDDAGVQPAKLDPAEAKKFLAASDETAWGAVIERSPEIGPQLRKLMTRQ